MSRTRLLREPEDRKDRMGGMTGREAAASLRGARKDTGGRDVDFRLSSDVLSIVLGSSSSRWPCAHSLVVASAIWSVWAAAWMLLRRRELSEFGGPLDVSWPLELKEAGARRCCGLAATAGDDGGLASLRVRWSLWAAAGAGESGNEAGRRGAAAGGARLRWDVEAVTAAEAREGSEAEAAELEPEPERECGCECVEGGDVEGGETGSFWSALCWWWWMWWWTELWTVLWTDDASVTVVGSGGAAETEAANVTG